MKTRTKPKRRLFLTKNFITMLVLLVVIIATISAWFTVNKTVEANNISVKVKSTQVDIAPCIKLLNEPDEPWYDSTKDPYSILSDGPGVFTDELTFSGYSLSKDCTGNADIDSNGVVKLIVPDFNITNDYDSVRETTGKDVNVNVEGVQARSQEYSRIEHLKDPTKDAPEYQYLEFEFYVRSKERDIQLAAESQLLGETETEDYGGSLYNPNMSANDPKRSIYSSTVSSGNPVNVDALVGAIRVSLSAEACNNIEQNWEPKSGTEGRLNIDTNAPKATVRSDPTKQILWYPRPDLKLDIPSDKGDITNWRLNTNLTNGDSFKNSYYYNNGNGVTKVEEDTDEKTIVSPVISNSIPTLGNNKVVSTFPGFTQSTVPLTVNKNNYNVKDDYYVTKYTMRIWIEGTDSEARRAMDGGKFNLTLKFV